MVEALYAETHQNSARSKEFLAPSTPSSQRP